MKNLSPPHSLRVSHAFRSSIFLFFAIAAGLTSRVFSATIAVPSPPNLFNNLGLWLSAADLAKTLSDGQPVTRWHDMSGHGYDAIFEGRIPQAAALGVGLHQPPVFRTNAPGEFPAVSFNAVDRQTLVLNMAGRALGQTVSSFTAVFVFRPSLQYPPTPAAGLSWTKTRYLFISHLSDYNTRVSVQVVQGTGEVKLHSRPIPGAAMERVSSCSDDPQLVLRDNAWQRLIITVDYQAKVARIFIDGRGMSRALSPTSANAFEGIPSPITGIGSTTFGDWMTCQIAELICFERALNLDEIHSLDAYICGKYHLPQ